MKWLFKTEREKRFGWNPHAAAASQNLCTCTRSGSSACTDCSTFAASGERSNDRADYGATSDVLTGPVVCAQTFSTGADHGIFRVQSVSLTVDQDRIHVERQLVVG
jgi:hypothetical protein